MTSYHMLANTALGIGKDKNRIIRRLAHALDNVGMRVAEALYPRECRLRYPDRAERMTTDKIKHKLEVLVKGLILILTSDRADNTRHYHT